MADDTTTEQPVEQPTGAEEAQPVVTDEPVAADVQTVDEPSEPSEDVEQPAEGEPDAAPVDAPQVDEKLQKYAASQGLELNTPSEIKAAQIAMKAQSEATRNYQKASELEKSVTATSDQYAEHEAEQTGQDPELLKTVRGLQVKDAVRTFWDTPLPNGETPSRELEQAMIAELATKPYLAGDLESLYAVAQLKSGTTATVKSQGKREALESLAHKQQAAVPAGNATTSGTPKAKPFAELSIAEMEKKLGVVRR